MHDDDADGKCLEIHFSGPDEPYLFAAALRQRLGDRAINLAWVIPSADGPAVLLSSSLLDDPDVRALMDLLEGHVVEDGAAQPWVNGPQEVEAGLGHAARAATSRALEAPPAL